MNILETSGYKNSKRKIKNNFESKKKLNIIISHIESVKDYNDLKTNPVSYLYGFEELKDDMSGYCRFSLDKNSKTGKMRLIFSCSNDTIKLEYISNEHYEDFKRYLRKV